MNKKTFIKKYGNSYIINLTPEEMKINKLNPGDIVEVMVEKVNKK